MNNLVEKKKYLGYHRRFMKEGILNHNDPLCYKEVGLCKALEGDELLKLFTPDYSPYGHSWWGSDAQGHMRGQYTPLRQTIVLFLAAMNNEL